jgi:hypothetical protein
MTSAEGATESVALGISASEGYGRVSTTAGGRITGHDILFVLGMKTERWFNVLVLGGAILGQACGTQEGRPIRRGTAGSGGTAGTDGASSPSAGDAGSDGSMAGSGSSGVSSPGGGDAGAGSTAGGTGPGGLGGAGSGGAGSGGAGSGGAGSGGAGSGGQGGSNGHLECHIDSTGHGQLRDPCGCPCCWANDCLNTEVPCCVVFCKSGNDGAGCCPQ